jgi:hypothetical protein
MNAKVGKRERIATDGTVKQLSATAYTVAETSDAVVAKPARRASGALIQVLTNSVIWTIDGTDPTGAIGFEAAPLDFITLETPQQLKDFKVTQKAAGGALEVLYQFGA